MAKNFRLERVGKPVRCETYVSAQMIKKELEQTVDVCKVKRRGSKRKPDSDPSIRFDVVSYQKIEMKSEETREAATVE